VARPRPVEPQPEIEAMLARYQLIDRIAEGTVSEVFTAFSHGGGGPRRTIAVKRLRPDQIENPAAVTHFTEEATLLSRLSHPNLVAVHDSGEVDGTYFIAEEYVVGRDLGRITRKLVEGGRAPLSPAGVLYVVHEVLGALAYLHAPSPSQDAPDGFLHHDLVPRKVIVSRLGKVKLLDFKIIRAHQQVPQAEIGAAKAMVDFMSPEQARGRPLDRRSDLFSVGLLLYHCATGEALYRGDTQYDRVSRAAHGPGPQEHIRITALPAPLPALLKKALDPRPERRFQTADEFLAAVAPYIEGGEDEVAGVISDLFDDELQQEIDRLTGSTAPTPAVGRA
jgi:eukaryotic-like serine/threonine-protein kinase